MIPFSFQKNNFDFIRLFAAFQVVLTHTAGRLEIENIPSFFSILDYFPGVPIFFVISGFLISASWERSPNLKSYITNRILRIYPALLICLVVSIFSVYLFYSFNASFYDVFLWVAAQSTILQFYNPDFLRGYGIGVLNGSLWTIPIELQFYIILPFGYFILNLFRWNKVLLLLLFSFFILINIIFVDFNNEENSSLGLKIFNVSIFPFLYFFFLGVILQKYIEFFRPFLQNKALYWLLIYLLFANILPLYQIEVFGNYLNPLSAILLGLLTISTGYSNIGPMNRWLKGNDVSYGIYIYHMVIVNVFVHLGIMHTYSVFIGSIIITFIFAIISWFLIEKPCLNLKRTTFRKSRQR